LINKVDLGKIKALRKSKKISLIKMAEMLGYKSPNGYYYLETGRCSISAEMLPRIAEILGVVTAELYYTHSYTEMVHEQAATSEQKIA
jgi:transcriptional regulator with XRE-family HTH domain